MFKHSYNIIGVMSGTSLDGIDLAHVIFTIKNDTWTFELLECETIPYSNEWLHQLKSAIDFSKNELAVINKGYTKHLARVISEFINKHNITELDAVSSHGHTILHQPQNGITLQIGNLPEIAKLTNQKVVCDFRVQDVALGGQGAPLVPIGDQILFSDYDYCLNLGGFSNISFNKNKTRVAFDISPVNTVLNFYANKLGFDYDDKGKIAQKGHINMELLTQLNNLDFYTERHPKSLGLEFVKNIIIPLIEKYNIDIEDKLATFTSHIAQQISFAIEVKNGKMLITGGGAYNDFLLKSISIVRLKFYHTDKVLAG